VSESEKDPVAELVALIDAAEPKDGAMIWNHTLEEIGLHVMENHAAVRNALSPRAEPPAKSGCGRCHDTGYVDFAHLGLDPCDHGASEHV
jgi:hypothetical protein